MMLVWTGGKRDIHGWFRELVNVEVSVLDKCFELEEQVLRGSQLGYYIRVWS
jgi:hypothetical protein